MQTVRLVLTLCKWTLVSIVIVTLGTVKGSSAD